MQFDSVQVSLAPEIAQLNIIILAGGFNSELVNEIIQKTKNDTLVKDTTATMLRKSKVCHNAPWKELV